MRDPKSSNREAELTAPPRIGSGDLLERRAKRLAYKRRWNSEHPGHWRNWPSSKNPKLKKQWRSKWKKTHPEMVRADNLKRHRNRVRDVTVTYIRNHWTNKWGLKNVPTALLETAAIVIKIQRELKQQNYGNTEKHRRTANRPAGRVSVGESRSAPRRTMQGNDQCRRQDHRHAQAGTRILHAAEGITKHRLPKLLKPKQGVTPRSNKADMQHQKSV